MLISPKRNHPSTRCPCQKSPLHQERFVDILDGVTLLADSRGEGFDADRPTAEFVDDGQEQCSIHGIHAQLIDFEQA